MKTRKHTLTMAGLTALVLLVLPGAAQADPIILTLDTTQTVMQGSSVIFMGRLENAGPPGRFINSPAINLTGPVGITFDNRAFFANVPSFLNAGQNSGPLEAFFDVFVSMMTEPGSYTGSFSVLGGSDDLAQNPLATQDFTIVVLGAEPIPEPATMFLLGSGLIGAAAARRRKRRHAQASTP